MPAAATQTATYDPSRTLYSLHVPKTAGTSFRHDLERWFGAENMGYHYHGYHREPPPRFEPRAGLCVHGHFNRLRGIGVRRYYPEASQFIVFLRDPFDRFVSNWRYLQFQVRDGFRVPELDDNPTFAGWLDRRRRAAEEGEDPFSYLAQLPDPVDPARAGEAFGSEFVGVGIAERYAESMRMFAAALGKPAPEGVTRLNTRTDPHREGETHEDLSAYRAEYEAAFPLEYAVYRAGLARLERDLQRLGA
ncbi:sulfotransferase family 2 domain-containing protein [Phenylobacterium soli]|uniref:Sulfotransferase family protein n=2 Tax=Phenylobacterium soli TaxID=2170551 RepID=A0A328AFL8_9CAUL|nr:sulfotransferase family 2 domain-containing protein [Phenylobacterium soli]RAK53520.1 hypothetical protein DJ017_02745 [Phenylobacterium soli]